MDRFRYNKTTRNGLPVYTEIYEEAEQDIDNPNTIIIVTRRITPIDPVAKVAQLTAEKADLQAQGQALQARINAITALGLKA